MTADYDRPQPCPDCPHYIHRGPCPDALPGPFGRGRACPCRGEEQANDAA